MTAIAQSDIELEQVRKAYGAVVAVDSVSLSIARGEFFSLLGPSGCGKTTTLRMIAGFLAPSEGTIEMDGDVISSPASSPEVFEVNKRVWLEVDPRQMARIE